LYVALDRLRWRGHGTYIFHDKSCHVDGIAELKHVVARKSLQGR
jgi:hypothetical protein